MDVRRVVTGHDPEGKAVFVSDGPVAPVTLSLQPGAEFHTLWGADAPVAFPGDGSRPAAERYFPPLGGFRFGFFTIPPDDGPGAPPDLDVVAGLAELRRKLPGLIDDVDPDEVGMHTTASVDFGVVLSGQALLELDDGATVVLDVGDTYIQNGTRHRWSNPGDVPAVLAVALVGAEHARVDAPARRRREIDNA
jgi:mannose-6-phosphate isomerase-like protein (cupin superfamily)